ncbi:MAG TPA: HAMP domain-containing sensor histidine kinase [Flavipsychrobacter sp.]|nr:HAMP domain-containing sensor histidine kinase [Flavipsychrobacter sp.]
MKRVFPLIVLLITLSVLGIMFIQMHWIQSAIFVKRQLHEKNIENSLIQIKEQMYNHFFAKHHEFGYIPNEMSRQDLLRRHFTIMDFSEDEIKGIIDSSLRKNDLKEKYEFAITNIFNQPITVSQNFQNEYFNTAIKDLITPVNALQVETLHLYIEDKNYIIKKMGGLIAASIFFTCIIISAFALTIRTMFKQKNLSEIKSDFINNMTHELKTPLATISLAIDALVNEKVIHDVEKIRYYSGMIKDENKRMNKQVEKILQAARIERQEIKLNLVELNAHDLITKVTDNLQLQIQEKNGTISLNLNADKSLIEADEVHFSNIIFNLLDNAIKYSKGNLHIDVETSIAHNDMLAIKIMDNGIGMSKETQQRVFEKFYRAHTGNIHNVKGFGLGLSYVKAITEAHGGKVKVESALGKGSTFTLFLPFHPED